MFNTKSLILFVFGSYLAIAVGGYFYFNYTQNKIDALNKNNVELLNNDEVQKETINNLEDTLKKVQESNRILKEQSEKLTKDLNDLSEIFNKNGRDFGKLAKRKPGLIEKRMNEATKKELECFEKITDPENEELTCEEK